MCKNLFTLLDSFLRRRRRILREPPTSDPPRCIVEKPSPCCVSSCFVCGQAQTFTDLEPRPIHGSVDLSAADSFRWITLCVAPRRSFPDAPQSVDCPKGNVNITQTTTRDTQSSNDGMCCMCPCALLLPEMQEAVSSPEAPSALALQH